MFERLSRSHHVLLAEGIAVFQLGHAAVLHAAPHLLEPLMALIFADAEIHSSDHLPNLSQCFGEVSVLLCFLCMEIGDVLSKVIHPCVIAPFIIMPVKDQ